VQNKIHHKFRNLNFSFMLEHSIFGVLFCFFYLSLHKMLFGKNVLEKKREKKLEKKRERESHLLSA